MLVRTKGIKKVSEVKQPEILRPKKPKKEITTVKKKIVKKRAVRCGQCTHFQNSIPRSMWSDRDMKAIYRVCRPLNEQRLLDSNICPFFEIADYIFCEYSHQWVHNKACYRRFKETNDGIYFDSRCKKGCPLGKELSPYLERKREQELLLEDSIPSVGEEEKGILKYVDKSDLKKPIKERMNSVECTEQESSDSE